ncbi:MAG: mannitol dehydrogenase family protein, partial [Steroidobacteraceae bacterium]
MLRAFAAPATQVVTLTVTEKGYCHDPATRRLLAEHAGLARDLAQPARPETTIGLVAAGLAAREGAGAGPITVLCCDNLPANGATLSQVMLDFARLRGSKLADHVARNVAFPSS